MYISTDNCAKLDLIIKDFEVAYRSYIVDKIIGRFPDFSSFEASIAQLCKATKPSSILNSGKVSGVIKSISVDIHNKFKNITSCYRSLKARDVCDGTVLYVSDLNNYVMIYFHELFSDCARRFPSIDEFISFSSKYHKTRNTLSHPASAKIFLVDCKDVLTFIRRLTNILEEQYFWYKTKESINEQIDSLSKEIEGRQEIKHNLFDINLSHKNFVCRDSELDSLYENMIGSDRILRPSGSALVYGYGGVGKTALVLEFAYKLIKKASDKELSESYEFIYFFSSKDEALKLFETTGKLYVDKIKKQIDSFYDFKTQLFSLLDVANESELKSRHGLVLVDNIENLTTEDREHLFDFIKKTPRSIKYILTSRNEESSCEFKLHLTEFSDEERGTEFITEYIKENDLGIELSVDEMKSLLHSSKGNTLILVLSLEGLCEKRHTVAEIAEQLERAESQNIEVIADFMYKNTFDETIQYLQGKECDPINIIKIISIYGESLDLYSISALSKVSRRKTEDICDTLARKLIINKSNGLYSLNEFANKFIFIKYLPNKIEADILRSKIYRYKENIDKQLDRLNSLIKTNSVLKQIMDDWKPRTYTDSIAISQAFNFFSDQRSINTDDRAIQNKMIRDINKVLEMTSHPYILFQKVRMIERFLNRHSLSWTDQEKNDSIREISIGYEHAIELIDFHYGFIKPTKSYAILKKNYGIFVLKHIRDNPTALRYLEEARKLLAIFPKDKVFFSILMFLSEAYLKMYFSTRNLTYLHHLTSTYREAERLGKANVVDFEMQNNFIDKFKKYII